MKRKLVSAWIPALVALAVPLWAHHALVAAYDMNQMITVKGTIAKVLLENPHSWFLLDVKDANGKVEQWSFEAGTPSGMLRNGYRPNLIKPGTEVVIKGYRARDTSQKKGMLRELTTPDGKTFGLFGPQENH